MYNIQDRHRVDRQHENLREDLNNSQTVNNIQQLRLLRERWLQNPFSELSFIGRNDPPPPTHTHRILLDSSENSKTSRRTKESMPRTNYITSLSV